MKYSILFLIAFLLSSCGSKNNSSNPTAPVSNTSAPVPEQSYESYPSISMAEMEELAKRTSNIDYIFYELPVSMNIDNAPAINSALRQISDQPAKIMKGCKPMGRVIFQDNGDIFKEADFYFQAPCFARYAILWKFWTLNGRMSVIVRCACFHLSCLVFPVFVLFSLAFLWLP